MRNAHLIHLLLGIGALALVGCEGEPPIDSYTAKKILVLGNSTEPQGLDPQIVTGVIESNIIRALFEGLCVEHPSKKSIPTLSPEIELGAVPANAVPVNRSDEVIAS